MNILIIGAGMYVTGRNKTGTGTILSSIAEYSKQTKVEKLVIAAKNPENNKHIEEALNRINMMIGSNLQFEYVCLGDDHINDLKNICQKTKFDCALVSVPDHLHFEYTKILFENKIHCLVVKPLTPSLNESLELVKLQEKYNTYGFVEFHKRYDETNLYIKRAITENKIGKLLYFTVDYSQKISIPTKTFKSWAAKTNIFQYLGVHYVDLIYFLTSYIPKKVTAIGTNGILKEKGINTYDSVHATIIWQNPKKADDEFISLLSISWIDPDCTSAMSDQKYKVIGTAGRIECDQKNRGIELVSENTGIQAVNPYFSEYLYDKNGLMKFQGYGYKSIENFLCDIIEIKNNPKNLELFEKSRPTFKNSLISAAIIDAVNNSLSNNSCWSDIDVSFRCK